MTERSCTDCKYAEWVRTAAGRLHPSGEGRCMYSWEPLVLPACYCWERQHVPKPSPKGKPGLDRHNPYTDCPTFSPKS